MDLHCSTLFRFIASTFSNISASFEIIAWSVSSDSTMESRGCSSKPPWDTQQWHAASTEHNPHPRLFPLISMRGRSSSDGKQVTGCLGILRLGGNPRNELPVALSLSLRQDRRASTSVETCGCFDLSPGLKHPQIGIYDRRSDRSEAAAANSQPPRTQTN